MDENIQQKDAVQSDESVLESPETASSDEAIETLQENSQQNEEVGEGQTQLLDKVDEIEAVNDKYLRLAAEFENYKRRVQRDQRDTLRFANEKLLRDMLPTLDNLERAIQSGRNQDNVDGILKGIDLTYKHFIETLQKMGVTQVSSVGEIFDPAKHQAVGHVESSSVSENAIVEEYQKGYFLHDRILRPAMVTVAKAIPAAPDGEATQPQEGAQA